MEPHKFELFESTGTWCKHCNCERDELPGMHEPESEQPQATESEAERAAIKACGVAS